MQATYEGRGWCYEESCISNLVKSGGDVLDLGLFSGIHTKEVVEIEGFGRFEGKDTHISSIVAECEAGREPPHLPQDFNLIVETKQFTNKAADLDTVKSLYKAAFEKRIGQAQHLSFTGLGWGDAEVVTLTQDDFFDILDTGFPNENKAVKLAQTFYRVKACLLRHVASYVQAKREGRIVTSRQGIGTKESMLPSEYGGDDGAFGNRDSLMLPGRETLAAQAMKSVTVAPSPGSRSPEESPRSASAVSPQPTPTIASSSRNLAPIDHPPHGGDQPSPVSPAPLPNKAKLFGVPTTVSTDYVDPRHHHCHSNQAAPPFDMDALAELIADKLEARGLTTKAAKGDLRDMLIKDGHRQSAALSANMNRGPQTTYNMAPGRGTIVPVHTVASSAQRQAAQLPGTVGYAKAAKLAKINQ